MKKVVLVLAIMLLVSLAVGVEIGFVAANLSAVTQATIAQNLEAISKTNGWTIYVSNSAGSWETMTNLTLDGSPTRSNSKGILSGSRGHPGHRPRTAFETSAQPS